MSRKHTTNGNGRKRRSARGQGRLYKRGPGGKDYPADNPINAPYWLQYTVKNPKGGKGKCVRVALRDADGNQITDRKQAEVERERIMAPYRLKDAAERERAILARVQQTEQALVGAEDAATPPLRLHDAEAAYTGNENRPDSGALTLSGYISQWQRFAAWMQAHHPEIIYMRDVARPHVKAYVADMAGLSASSFNQHVNTLRRFWRVLAEDARTTDNPWLAVSHKTVERVERRHRVLTMAEATSIIEAATGDMKDLLAMIALTGQRLQDVAKLRWSSVDFDNGIITLIPTKTRRRTGKAVFIPLMPQARAILQSRPRIGKMVFPDMAALFDRDRGSTLAKRIRDVIENAGFTPHEDGTGFVETTGDDGKVVKEHSGQRAVVLVSAHSLRHTYTTIARAAGIPDAVIRSIVGHTTSAMTEHYTAFDKAIVAQLASRFEAIPAGQYQLTAGPQAHKEPLPTWARELVESITSENAATVKAVLLKGGVA
jgi:integrase